MGNLLRLLASVVIWIGLVTPTRADDAPIRLNTVGFLPDHDKRGSVAAECTEFAVVRTADGERVFTGRASAPAENADTGERLVTLDFSALRQPGVYAIDLPGVGRSPSFRIASDVYAQPFVTVTRGMYLWRCGTAVRGTYEGQTFAHDACHTADAFLDFVGGGHVKRDATKGWHDAGDYNKYVVNAGVTVGCMFRAWEDFGDRLKGVSLDIPESGGKTPDFLAEIKWELDWLLTMQADDGSVYHKVSTQRFGGFVMPERETADRFFTSWGSAATADFVAVTSAAARIYRPYDPPFADRCLAAARKSYAFLQARPDNHPADLRNFSTGPYQTNDADDRLWAAAELWQTTGDADALKDVEARVRRIQGRVEREFDWGNVGNLGLFTYVFSQRTGRDESLVARLRQNVIATADEIVKARDAHGYARPLGTRYGWGANGTVARQTLILQAANRVQPTPEYVETALDAIGHLFGRNVYGRSFVTGIGYHPPLHPHDRRSGGDTVDAPWPGYLIGGPHPKPTDWHDVQDDYRTNEIAINWNGALIYALAGFVPETH